MAEAADTYENTIIHESREGLCNCKTFTFDTSNKHYTGEYDIVGTSAWCRQLYYDNVIMICVECGRRTPVTYGIMTQHPTLSYNTQTGKYYCSACGYVQE